MTTITGLLSYIGSDEVSSCLEKRDLSAAMCEERSIMWTLHHAVILKGNHVDDNDKYSLMLFTCDSMNT